MEVFKEVFIELLSSPPFFIMLSFSITSMVVSLMRRLLWDYDFFDFESEEDDDEENNDEEIIGDVDENFYDFDNSIVYYDDGPIKSK